MKTAPTHPRHAVTIPPGTRYAGCGEALVRRRRVFTTPAQISRKTRVKQDDVTLTIGKIKPRPRKIPMDSNPRRPAWEIARRLNIKDIASTVSTDGDPVNLSFQPLARGALGASVNGAVLEQRFLRATI